MSRIFFSIVSLVLPLIAFASYSSTIDVGEDKGGVPGVGEGQDLATMSDEQLGKFCDWILSRYGTSYGKDIPLGCDAGVKSVLAWEAPAECISTYASATRTCKGATMTHLKACIESGIRNALACNWGDETPECGRLASLGCHPYFGSSNYCAAMGQPCKH